MALSETEQQVFRAFEKSGWEQAADPYHRHWGLLSAQSAEAMLDRAGVTGESRVLDVATGAGYVAAAAAKRGATTAGIDFSSAQVELALSTFPGIDFRQASAEALPFDDNSFDAVVMGFGMNHLPDPEAAFREAHRVLVSGGRFAFTVWAEPKAGEGFGIVLSAIETHGLPNVNLPAAPPYFRFADAAEASRVFAQTGFVDARTEIVPQFWRHRSPDAVFDAFNEGAVRATAMLRSQPAEVREIIRESVRAEVMKLAVAEGFLVPVPAALSYAVKP